MRIAKPILLVTTPLGLVGGLYEGYRLAGHLVWLMVVLIAFMGAALFFVVRTIRREGGGRGESRPGGRDTQPGSRAH